MKKYLPITLASILLASSLLGQTPGPVQDPLPVFPPTSATEQIVNQLTILLSLDPVQKAGVSIYVTAEQKALTGMNTRMTSATASLTAAVESNDTVALTNAASQIGSLASQEALTQGTAESQIFALLTSDQQLKYKLLLSGTVIVPPSACKPGTSGCLSPM
jgi:hypothetical protein